MKPSSLNQKYFLVLVSENSCVCIMKLLTHKITILIHSSVHISPMA